MKYYYLLNGKIMSANEKMPELRIVQHKDYNQKFEDSKFKMFYNNWLNSLQPCEISESELCLILSNVTKLDYDNPIEVTDMIKEINDILYFFMKTIQLTKGQVALVDDEAAKLYHGEFANLNFK